MGLFDFLKKDKSGKNRSSVHFENSTNGSAYEFFKGISESGQVVTEKSSMQISAIYACVRILSEAVASLPLGLYMTDEKGLKTRAVDDPLYRLVHDEPNPEMSSFNFRETMMIHLLLWGNAYAQIQKNGKGEITALYPLMPDRMKVDRDEKRNLYYEYQVEQGDAPSIKAASVIRFRPEQILHIAGLGFDGLIGYSPVAMAKNVIGMTQSCEEYGSKFFKNGAYPGGVLEHPGTLEDPEKVRDSWNRAFGGASNAGKVAVLEEGMKYQPISFSPEQSQLSQTREYQLNEIARIFRIPPHMLGDLTKASYASIEQQSIEFVKYTLNPWLVRWEQAMSRRLLDEDKKGRYYFKFNVDGLLRGDYNSRMSGYAIGRQNGWLSANDIRKLEDMDMIPAEEGGDLYLVNGNMAKLEDAGAAYEAGILNAQLKAAQNIQEGDETE